jgi:hypothetical protein
LVPFGSDVQDDGAAAADVAKTATKKTPRALTTYAIPSSSNNLAASAFIDCGGFHWLNNNADVCNGSA